MKDHNFTVVFLLVFLFAFLCEKVVEGASSYAGYKIVRATISNETQLNAVKNLNLDVWSGDSVLKIGSNDIRVNDYDVIQLYQNNVQLECLLPNLQNEVDREAQELGLDQDLGIETISFVKYEDDWWFNLYHAYTDIVVFLQGLASDYSLIATYPFLLFHFCFFFLFHFLSFLSFFLFLISQKYSSIGTTYEGRDIPAVKITGTAKGLKQKVLVLGGLHAREWISPAVAIYIAQELATLYGADDSVTSILNQFELHFLPVANPDGFVYSWGTSRTWRKNRRANADGSYGVDLNKNFNTTGWKSACTSPPASDTYCGTAPFSENETSSIRDYVLANGPFNGAVEYSSYSQQVLRPFGYTSVPPSNGPVLKTIGDAWAGVINGENQLTYSSVAANSVNSAAGSVRDWLYSFANVTLSFTIEVRDFGGYGFILPPIQIIPTCHENYAGFKYFLQSVRNYA